MSVRYLEHHEIIDEINRRRESRQLRETMGRQALSFHAIPKFIRGLAQWTRDAYELRDCANGSHDQLQIVSSSVFDLGNGQERVCRVMKCDRCGEWVNTDRIRPSVGRLETNEPGGDTPGPSALRR